MLYLRCAGTGLLAALSAAVLWILWSFALPILINVLGSGGTGVGSITIVIDSDAVLTAAAVGFVAGFAWRWWRLRTARS